MADTSPLNSYKVAPLAPGAGALTDTPEAQQYQDAINQSMKALEGRMNPQTNLWNVAAGFLKPTRGGSFGESMGNAAEAIGAEQEREQREAVPIAQMRAALAGQKYEMGLRGKAMESLNAMTGISPSIMQSDLPAIAKTMNLKMDDPTLAQFVGQPKSAFMSGTGQSVIGLDTTPSITKEERNMALTASGGKPAEAVKMIFDRQTKWGEPSQMQKDLKFAMDPATPPAVRQIVLNKLQNEANRLGFDYAAFEATTGTKLPGAGGTPAAPASAPAAPAQAAPAPLNKYGLSAEDEKYIVRNPDGSVKDIIARDSEPSANPSIQGQPVGARAEAAPSEFSYPDGTPINIPPTWPAAKRSEYVADRLKEYQTTVERAEANTGKVYEKKMAAIGVIDPGVLSKQNIDFNEAKAILADPSMKPVLGKMYTQGLIPGGMTMLNNGIKFGNYAASIDVYDVWLRTLTPAQQSNIKRLDQILGGAYMAAASAKPFGAAPSNYEDLQLKSTMATAKDPEGIIRNFLVEQAITNTHLIDMRNRFDTFVSNKSKNVQPYGFFGTPGYKESQDIYKNDYKAYKALGIK